MGEMLRAHQVRGVQLIYSIGPTHLTPPQATEYVLGQQDNKHQTISQSQHIMADHQTISPLISGRVFTPSHTVHHTVLVAYIHTWAFLT